MIPQAAIWVREAILSTFSVRIETEEWKDGGIVKVRTALAWAIALLLAPQQGFGFDIPADLQKRLVSEMEGKPNQQIMDGESPDNSIDPSTYLVGGGDGFRISIVGLPSKEYFPIVDLDGNLYDGDLGFIALGRIPLAKAIEVISEKVRGNLKKNYQVYVTLRKIKRASVNVTGAVNVAGTYQLQGTHRLLDAIRAANNGTLPPFPKGDYRKVTVRNRDSVKTYDLLRFFSKQDLSQNPYVYPGDNVNLKPIDAMVYVSGEVMEPVTGWVSMVPGESLGDLLGVLNLKQSADSGSILVQKADSPSRRALKRISLQEAPGFILHPNDLITIGSREDFPRPDTVSVTGEVKRPGTYPVVSARASLRELIELSGGATEQADPARTVIIRHRRSNGIALGIEEKDAMMIARGKNMAGSIRSVRPEISASISDLQTLRDYTLVQSARSDSLIQIQDGDEVYVPRQDPFVYVSGNVKTPGAYPYSKGMRISDYIEKAGGYTEKADSKNQFVLASYNGVSQIHAGGEPSQGDLIVVPSSVEYKTFMNVVFPILQLVPSVLSVVLSIIILTK